MATYFIDWTNGNDTKNGTKDGNHTTEASTDGTHVYVTDGTLTDGDADDFFNGDYLFNVTRSAGALVTDYDADDGSGNSVVTHGNIAGQVSGDTFYILKSWKSVEKYLENTPAAGDTAYVRGNQTHTYNTSDVSLTGDGTVDAPITISGCYTAAGEDAWGDGNTTRPVMDFGSAAYQFLLNNDNVYIIQSLDFSNSHDTSGAIQLSTCNHITIDDCRFYDNGTTSSHMAIKLSNCVRINITSCAFDNNFGYGVYVGSSGEVCIEDCVFDGDAAMGSSAQSTDYGIMSIACHVKIKDCTFGVTGEHDGADIRLYYGGTVVGRNCLLDSTTQVSFLSGGGYVMIEDNGQVHNAFKVWYKHGTVTRSAVVERSGSGGTNWSILVEPNANCGVMNPLHGAGTWLRGVPLYLDGTAQTITVYAYADSTGGGWTPNASQFYIEVEHYEGAADWESDVSTDTFAAEDQWESFAITLTPGAAGFAYLTVCLKNFVAGAKIYIDPVPVGS